MSSSFNLRTSEPYTPTHYFYWIKAASDVGAMNAKDVFSCIKSYKSGTPVYKTFYYTKQQVCAAVAGYINASSYNSFTGGSSELKYIAIVEIWVDTSGKLRITVSYHGKTDVESFEYSYDLLVKYFGETNAAKLACDYHRYTNTNRDDLRVLPPAPERKPAAKTSKRQRYIKPKVDTPELDSNILTDITNTSKSRKPATKTRTTTVDLLKPEKLENKPAKLNVETPTKQTAKTTKSDSDSSLTNWLYHK